MKVLSSMENDIFAWRRYTCASKQVNFSMMASLIIVTPRKLQHTSKTKQNKKQKKVDAFFFSTKSLFWPLTRFMLIWLNLFCTPVRAVFQSVWDVQNVYRKLTESEAIFFCYQISTISQYIPTIAMQKSTQVFSYALFDPAILLLSVSC